MLPILHLGPWQISTYNLSYAVAALVAGMYGIHRLLRLRVRPPVIIGGVCLTVAAGFLSAFLVRLLPTLQRLLLTGVWDWVGGSSYIGGLLGGIGTLALYSRWQKMPLARVFDQVLPALPLAQAIGRLGCFAAGCCYGKPTTSWLGLYLPDHDGSWALRYPTQLLSAGADLLILAVLLIVERARPGLWPGARSAKRGQEGEAGLLALLYVGLYCLKRFAIEFLRGDSIPLVGSISWVHLYALAGMVLAAALISWKLYRAGSWKPEVGSRGKGGGIERTRT